MDRTITVGGALSLAFIAVGAWAGPASAEDFGLVVHWGASGEGQCDPPPSVGPVAAVAAGGFHSVALGVYGEVFCWGAGGAGDKGEHGRGQAIVPSDLGAAVAVAAGKHHTLAIRANGTLRAWGANESGQCSPPISVGSVTHIAAGGAHSLAIRTGGAVAGWGSDWHGQCAPPWTLGSALAIAAGDAHSAAVRVDGTVACWGANESGQVDASGELDSVTAVAAGESHTVALRADGSIACWGSDAYGQCRVPPGIEGFAVVSIAAGARHTVAALDDGSVVAWGDGTVGQCSPPTDLARTTCVSAGRAHSIAVACTERRVNLTTGLLGPIGGDAPRERVLHGLPPAIGPVRVTVRARADLGEGGRFLTVLFNGIELGRVLGDEGHACPDEPDEQTITVTDHTLNLALLAGARSGDPLADVRVRVEASPGVKLAACPSGDVECIVTYAARPRGCIGSAFTDPCEDLGGGRDCDGNGRRDACDIIDGAEDSDGDGLPDSCERAHADLNLDGRIDALDLDAFVTNWWGQRDPAEGDFDRDGMADSRDLAALLGWWGEIEW